MALAGKYSPEIEALINKLKNSNVTFDRSKITTIQRNKDAPVNSNRYSGRSSFSSSSPAPSTPQALFGKDSFSGLDAPPTKAYTKEEYDGIIANAMAAGRARNNVKSGTKYDLGGEPTWR